MIQRIQSIYLLLVTVLMSMLVIMPYGEVTTTDQLLILKSYATTIVSGDEMILVFRSTIPVIVLSIVIGLISFITILLYKNRKLQIRISVINAGLILFLTASMLYYFFTTRSLPNATASSFRLAMIFPVLGFILCIMAMRYIQRDEILVNSYNRLR